MGATTTTLTSVLSTQYDPVIVEILGKRNYLMSVLPWVEGTGKRVDWKVLYAGNTSANSYSEGEATPASGQQSYQNPYLEWKMNRVIAETTGLSQALSRQAGSLVKNAMRDEVNHALVDLIDEMESQILSDGTGNSSKDITGVLAALQSTGTYAAIDASTYTWWAANVDANGGTARPLTVDLMQTCKEDTEDYARKGRISALMSNSFQWKTYGNLLVANRQYVPADKLDGGFMALDFEGRPYVRVDSYNAGEIGFYDLAYWDIQYVPQDPNDETEFGENAPAPAASPGGVKFAFRKLAKNGDESRIMVCCYAQLRCRNPYRQGRLDDLATS